MRRMQFTGYGLGNLVLPYEQISDLYFSGKNLAGEEQAKTSEVIKQFYDNHNAGMLEREQQNAVVNNQLNNINNWLRPLGFTLGYKGGGTNKVTYWLIGGELGKPKLEVIYNNLPSLSEVQSTVNQFLSSGGSNQQNTSTPQTQAYTPNPVTNVATQATSGYTNSNAIGTTIVNPASGVYTISNGTPVYRRQDTISYNPTVKDEIDYMKYGMFAIVGVGLLILLKKEK